MKKKPRTNVKVGTKDVEWWQGKSVCALINKQSSSVNTRKADMFFPFWGCNGARLLGGFLKKKDVQHIEDVMQISEVKYSKINTKWWFITLFGGGCTTKHPLNMNISKNKLNSSLIFFWPFACGKYIGLFQN